MRRIGTQLLKEKRGEIMREAAEGKEKARSRDLLTLLLKANMATDIPENQRLSDEDVIARTCIPRFSLHGRPVAHMRCVRLPQRSPRTSCSLPYPALSLPTCHLSPENAPEFVSPRFLVAGHETTSTATTWCLFALTQAPAVQAKLRAELLALDTDTPSMDQLNDLPYLDYVVRETLRVHAPVPTTTRQAARDDVIPVAEPFVDRHGVVQDSIK